LDDTTRSRLQKFFEQQIGIPSGRQGWHTKNLPDPIPAEKYAVEGGKKAQHHLILS
jgi:hypothetical protein